MSDFIVTVSITYRLMGSSGAGTTVTRVSSCVSAPFSIGLDRSKDGFFLYYNGGEQLLESGWNGYDLLSAQIIEQTPCEGEKYDCINGACLKAGVYNSPGFYASLSECEKACGLGCSGKCLSNVDWAAIEGLANRLKNKNCGG
jgi:hypothetical protein